MQALGPEAQAALLAVFTGEILGQADPREKETDAPPSSWGTASTPSKPSNGGGASLSTSAQDEAAVTTADLVRVERVLWSILTSSSPVWDAAVPTRAEAALCLRFCRRLLNASKWRAASPKGLMTEFAFGGGARTEERPSCPEGEEFFSAVQMLCVLSRALVLSYNALDKQQQSQGQAQGQGQGQEEGVTFGALLAALPPGTTSDVANSLLESLELCAALWRKRFDAVHFSKVTQGGAPGCFLPDGGKSGSASRGGKGGGGGNAGARTTSRPRDTLFSSTAAYLTQDRPAVPCRAVFEALNLRQQQESVEATFRRLFGVA
jgi:hypothetical protein